MGMRTHSSLAHVFLEAQLHIAGSRSGPFSDQWMNTEGN